MSNSPEIQWLIDRWHLPNEEAALQAVKALLEEQRSRAGTALSLTSLANPVTEWGNAAKRAEEQGESPLVLVNDGKNEYLQSRRCYLAERAIARRIHEIASHSASLTPTAGEDPLKEQIDRLFPSAGDGDLQVKALQAALEHRLLVLTGGPGTGKTFTCSRILALLLSCGISPDFVSMAAPTGKAADRMKQAVEESLKTLEGCPERIKVGLDRIARRSSTLHSLLGYNPAEGRCRHNSSSPLPSEVLIVDECSMVDVHLFQALLEALPKTARLLLLGDPMQLQSVGQGNVLADLVAHARDTQSPWLIHLTESKRFRDRPGISHLAKALEEGDEEDAVILLRHSIDNTQSGLTWIEPKKDGALAFKDFPGAIVSAVEAVASAPDPITALELLGKVCILTAHRNHSVGAEAIGNAITRDMKARNITTPSGSPANIPIIINENDPETGLRNGAVGILHTGTDGIRRAYFRQAKEEPKSFPVGALPNHIPAWAITIHRSQGSEYDDVLVILPREESPLATRELLYTAITRAKKNVHIAGSLDVVRKAVKTRSQRVTLLTTALDFQTLPGV